MTPEQQEKFTALRTIYSGALVTGPFSIILGFNGGMVALNDRLKLRSLVAAEHGSRVYAASEESAIRVLCPEPGQIRLVYDPTTPHRACGIPHPQSQLVKKLPPQVELKTPIMFSAMSFGSISRNARKSLAMAAREMGTKWAPFSIAARGGSC